MIATHAARHFIRRTKTIRPHVLDVARRRLSCVSGVRKNGMEGGGWLKTSAVTGVVIEKTNGKGEIEYDPVCRACGEKSKTFSHSHPQPCSARFRFSRRKSERFEKEKKIEKNPLAHVFRTRVVKHVRDDTTVNDLVY